MAQQKNVLFITADQWRADCLSMLGHPCLKTPNLDRLAADGILFQQHYCQATPCGPSRASLYTGLYMHNHGSVNNGTPLDARHTNIALEARKAGYAPVLFGYTDTSADPRHLHPGDPDLRSYQGVLPGIVPMARMDDDKSPRPWIADLRSKGYEIEKGPYEVYRPTADYPGAKGRGPTFPPSRYSAEDSQTAYLTTETIKYIDGRPDEPWFVHLSYLSPHPPFVVPEPYHDLYDPKDTPPISRAASREEEGRQHPWLAYFLSQQKGKSFTVGYSDEPNLALSDAGIQQLRATYYGMISEVDAQIGRLIDYLKEIGQYDNTLIVVGSDHGEMLGDHWLFGKYGYFDQAFHVPLIVRDPLPDAAAARGQIVSAFTENIDVMPTILQWLGLEIPEACDGESLLRFCHGVTPSDWRREVHWSYDFRDVESQKIEQSLGLASDQCGLSVIRGKRYKYVHFTALKHLFFDLEKDPWEQNNLADDPAYQSLVLEYAQMMLSWRMNHEDRVLRNTKLAAQGPVVQRGPRRSATGT